MTEIENAMTVLKKAFKDDPSYAHTWHCNLACTSMDAAISEGFYQKVAHRIGNDAASRFMKLCFDVETSNEVRVACSDLPEKTG